MTRPRPVASARCISLALAIACVLGSARATADADLGSLTAAVAQARELVGSDPGRARQAIVELRTRAMREGELAARLSIDEIDCRFVGDSDADAAVKLADAGLAASSGPIGPAAAAARLRLRACRAGALVETGRTDEGLAEIEDLLNNPAASPAGPARALALLERGLYRSRTGALEDGQADLLAACTALAGLEVERDKDLCLGHLANHYKRMGDSQEALRLLEELENRAHERGALLDESVYLFGIAQVWHERKAWAQAMKYYDNARRASERLHDNAGVAYADAGIGAVLLEMGHAAEARSHLEDSLRLLPEYQDPKQSIRARLTLAQIAVELGETRRAAAALGELEQPIRAYRDDVLRAAWLRAETQLQAGLHNWEQAYRALEAWREIDERRQAQRLSDDSARLRMQFNRDRDQAQLHNVQELERQAEKQSELRGLVLAMAVALILCAVAFAVTKIREARRSHLLSLTDELTGLGNRRAILHFLDIACAESLRHGASLAVLMIDVDRFKMINDTHGHAGGDEVLRRLGAVVGTALRAQDRLGRVGGEEFLAVLPHAGPEVALAIAERIRQRVGETSFALDSGPLSVTVSIGIAGVPQDALQASSLLLLADRALYAAKAAGRDRVVGAAQVVAAPTSDQDAIAGATSSGADAARARLANPNPRDIARPGRGPGARPISV